MTREPFAARLLIASRGALIEEILRLRGELAASERDRERHGATVILWEQATADRERLRAELAAAQAERDEMRIERDSLRTERDALAIRRDELLALVARVTNETPFPDEVKGWESQRAAMIAQVGTLRAELAAAQAERDEARRERDIALARGGQYLDAAELVQKAHEHACASLATLTAQRDEALREVALRDSAIEILREEVRTVMRGWQEYEQRYLESLALADEARREVERVREALIQACDIAERVMPANHAHGGTLSAVHKLRTIAAAESEVAG